MPAPKSGKRRERGTGGIEVLPSGRFRGRWRSLDGRSLSYTADTRKEVVDHIGDAFADQRRLGYDPAKRTVTVNQLCDEWWKLINTAKVEHSPVKPRSVERYEDHLAHIRRILGPTPAADVTYERVQAFVAELQGVPLAPKTVRACYAVLAMVLQHAQRLGRVQRAIPKPILPKVSKPKLTIPTREEVDRLAEASDKRLWAPVILAGYCGLREGELLALHRADVHLTAEKMGDSVVPPHVFVHHARNKTSGAFESTKTEGVRRVYLPNVVNKALAWHLAEYPGDLLVPVSASVVQKSWQLARHRCSLDRVRFHDLRHAAASIMIAAGLSVKEVSEQLGHANATQTLDTYLHLWPHSWDGAMRRLDEYLAG